MIPAALDFLPRRLVSLLTESGQREERAAAARRAAYGSEVQGYKPAGVADDWPDPYGPDPVVFGSVPRVRS